jgi:TolB-like protein/class 3 adenylate cyclase/Tfp pilus assembly protein PilF
MNESSRRLAAIMHTDLVGFSRLMAENEQHALGILGAQRALLLSLIAEHRGTLHKELGDRTLSTFGSAVDAFACALAVQQRLHDQGRFELRIGLHVGDVVFEGDDLFGDGINIAARLEALAPPGGIALSDAVAVQARGKITVPLQSIGRPMLKNLDAPLEVFQWKPEAPPGAAAALPEPEHWGIERLWHQLRRSRLLQWTTAYLALAFAVLQGVALLAELFAFPAYLPRLVAIMLGWGAPMVVVVAWFHGSPGRQRLVLRERLLLGALALCGVATAGLDAWRHAQDAPLQATAARNAVAPQATEGVVVLAFDNPGGAAEDDYLAEGFSDELRDQLSRVRGLRVLARDSSIAFRGSAQSYTEIAAKLGVAVLVEGTLRKYGEQMRISVRLIDGASGAQRWSESYDRNPANLLAAQQDIALAAASQIQPQLTAADIPQPRWAPEVNDLMLLARTRQQNALRPAEQQPVIELYQRVLQADPTSATAHARLARALLMQGRDPAAAERHVRRAIELDPNLSDGYSTLGLMLWGQFRRGSGAALRRAVELNPNDAEATRLLAHHLNLKSLYRESQTLFARARELDPMSLATNTDFAFQAAHAARLDEVRNTMTVIEHRFPSAEGRYALSRIANTAGQLDEAIAWALAAQALDPAHSIATGDLAQLYARLGLRAESRRLEPDPSLATLFWERDYAGIIERMAAMDLDEADADALGYLAFALQALGRHAEAIPVLESMGLPEVALDDDLRRWAALHHLMSLIGAHRGIGDVQEARRLAVWLDDFRNTFDAAYASGWGNGYWIACALATLGRTEEALDSFVRSARATNLAWQPLLRDASCLQPIAQDPRYTAALNELEARHQALRERLPQTLARIRSSG